MKRLKILVLLAALTVAESWAQSGVYVGGHIRRERPTTIEKLRQSGFRYVILFNVNVEADGTLTTDGETICRDGQYVFDETQPHYADDVRLLKTAPTSIERLEICIGGWGNQSYQNIRALVNSDGTGENSILRRNFRALKEALPDVEAVNNDDEHAYDAASATKFHVMMYDLGYRTTLAPYTNKTYWQQLTTALNRQRPGACDRIMIQCYDGGAYNNPKDWHLADDIPLHAGRTNYQTDMQTSVNQMQTWRDDCEVTGGFVWIYNDETWSLQQWAVEMNRVFPKHADEGVVTCYAGRDYTGFTNVLPVGRYCVGELAAWGFAPLGIGNVRIAEGYELTLFTGDNFTGTSRTYTDPEPALGAFRSRARSLIIAPTGQSGIMTMHKEQCTMNNEAYDLQGRRIDATHHRGLIITRDAQGRVRKSLR